jgi:phosphoribosylformylglycinamidine cyclo-ligase
MLPIFQILQAKGGVAEEELYQVFNMGIGMTLIVDGSKADAIMRQLKTLGVPSWIIGGVVKGQGLSRVE